MSLSSKKGKNKGFFVPEIVIVVAIISIALTTLLGVVNFSLSVYNLIEETSQANLIAESTMEKARSFRDSTDWTADGLGTVDNGVSYYFQKTTSDPPSWDLVRGTDTTGKFTHWIIFEAVQRGGKDNIVESGGIEDPNTKKAVVTVSWQHSASSKEVEISTYFTNWQK